MKIPSFLFRIHHGYIGLVLMAIGLYMEVNTWDAQGKYHTFFPFQDVFGWVFVGAGIGLFMSDLIEHWITKEKHGGEFPKLEEKKP